jgi:3-oxoacyl-[acyl-carrier-protein] synthase-3
MHHRVRLLGVAAALPPRERTSDDVETILAERNPALRLRPGTIAAMTGIQARRVADDGTQCSDLAVDAGRLAMERAGLTASEIDTLIFAAASQDLVEPATAHIVQQKLGTACPVFDVKNACNSFLNGVQLGESLILSGAARHVLVTTGEICSRAIDWRVESTDALKRNLPAYTMGDAGAAAVLAPTRNGEGIFYRRFAALSHHWELATIPGGGSMHPRGDEFTYLRGDGARLKQAFVEEGARVFGEMMAESGASFAEFDRIFVHQVSVPYHREMLEASGMPDGKVARTVVGLGNMASASIPVAFAIEQERGALSPGDRVMWVGMASGISVGVFMMELG